MSQERKCALCGKRAGDRFCPALDAYICSTCCGLHRRKSIACPPDCPYLVEAERRRRARRAQELARSWERLSAGLAQGGRGRLVPYLELLGELLAELARQGDFRDGEAVAALRYLARKLSPIEIVETYVPPLGKLLLEALSPLLARGSLDPAALREACLSLAELAEAFGEEGEPDKFVAALLGTYPERGPGEGSRIIVRP